MECNNISLLKPFVWNALTRRTDSTDPVKPKAGLGLIITCFCRRFWSSCLYPVSLGFDSAKLAPILKLRHTTVEKFNRNARFKLHFVDACTSRQQQINKEENLFLSVLHRDSHGGSKSLGGLGLVPGGYLTKFNTGRLRPGVQPLTLLYTILAEKVPLLYTF